jgi:hypothetical protein
MPQDQQLDVLRARDTATSNQRAKQSPEREIEKGEDHANDLPTLAERHTTPVLAPFTHRDRLAEGVGTGLAVRVRRNLALRRRPTRRTGYARLGR